MNLEAVRAAAGVSTTASSRVIRLLSAGMVAREHDVLPTIDSVGERWLLRQAHQPLQVNPIG